MNKLTKLIRTELPSPIAKREERILGLGTAMILTAPLMIPICHQRLLVVMFMTLGMLYIAYALCGKSRIIKEGYKAHVFRVYDYTYLSRMDRSPSGMLMRSVEENCCIKYHLAYDRGCGLPEIGSVIKVYVPEPSMPRSYGERWYYPIVLGYEIAEEK